MDSEPRAKKGSGVGRVLRAGLIALSVIAVLAAISVGGTITAQRFSDARHATVAAPIVFASQQAPSAQLGASTQQAPTPTPVGKCGNCSSVKQSAPVSVVPPAPSAACTGARLPLPSSTPPNPPSSVAIPSTGKYVLVSMSMQWLWAYNNGVRYLATPVTTGMPGFRTNAGTFHIFLKETNVWFYSYYPPGSPGYYTPEFIPYAMEYDTGGFYLHAAPWRHQFGPGTENPHCDADGTWETGSHGCVNMPTSVAGELYRWINIGTTVKIVY
jgi:lipoprotein-anchoring transpeptidase ErfK/SrfK